MRWQFTRHNLRLPVFWLLVIILGGFFSSVGATTSEVSPALGQAVILSRIAALKPSDVLIFRGGVYPYALDNVIPAGSAWSSAVTLRAYPGERPILKPPSGSYRVLGMTRDNIAYIIMDGFTYDASGCLYEVAQVFGNHIRIMNFDMFGANGPITPSQGNQSGIYMGRVSSVLPASFNEFINGKIHDGGSKYAWNNGIYCEGEGNLFNNVEVYRWGGAGIQLYNSHGNTVHRNIVRGCKIHDLPSDQTSNGKGQGVVVTHGDGNQVINTTIWNIGTGTVRCCGGIEVNWGASNTLLSGNVIRDCKVPAIYIGASVSKTIVKCSTYLNNYQNLVNDGTGTVVDNSDCGGTSTPPPPATNVDVTQQHSPVVQPLPPVSTSPPVVITSTPPPASTSGANLGMLAAFVVGGVLLASLSKD